MKPSPTKSPWSTETSPEHLQEAPTSIDNKLWDLEKRTSLTVRADQIFAELLSLTTQDEQLAEVQTILTRMHEAVRYNIYTWRPNEAIHVIDMAEQVLEWGGSESGLLDNLIDLDTVIPPNIAKLDKLLGRFFGDKQTELWEIKKKIKELRSDIVALAPASLDEGLAQEETLSKGDQQKKSKELEKRLTDAVDKNASFFTKAFGITTFTKSAMSFAIKLWGLAQVDQYWNPVHAEVEEFLQKPSLINIILFTIQNLASKLPGAGSDEGKSESKVEKRLSSFEAKQDEVFYENQSDISVFSQNGFHVVTHSKKKEMLLQVWSVFYEVEKTDDLGLFADKINSLEIKDRGSQRYSLILNVDGVDYEIALNDFVRTHTINPANPEKEIHVWDNLQFIQKEVHGLGYLKSFLPNV